MFIDYENYKPLRQAHPKGQSYAEFLGQQDRLQDFFAQFKPPLDIDHLTWIEYDWRFWARPKQIAPKGDWLTWILRAGRGFGKTRTGAGWVHERAIARKRWIALIAKNPADARDFMIEGPGGFLKNTHPQERPLYEVSKRRLTWPNGSWATVFSDEEPEQLRGFSGDTAWLDEFGKYRNPKDVLDNLDFGMREVSEDDHPRKTITTTPRPIPALMDLEKRSTTIVTVGSSYENRSNLDPTYFDKTIAVHEGTKFGRQEINAEYVTEVPGALWTRSQFDRIRVKKDSLPDMKRVVVGVDPSGSSGMDDERANLIGIVAAGLGRDGLAYVLADRTLSASPAVWGRRAVELYEELKADRIVAEKNFGGDMVRFVLQTANMRVPVRMVTASRGKVIRAEPIASLYEDTPKRKGMVRHVEGLADLEDQMCWFMPDGYIGDGSPDRADAAIWALTELLLGGPKYSAGKGMGAPVIVQG